MGRRKGVRKYFTRPHKGCRSYGSMKNFGGQKRTSSLVDDNNSEAAQTAAAEHGPISGSEHNLNVDGFKGFDVPPLVFQEQVGRPFGKRRLRVLSLFDGISCGYYVLTSVLKVRVEKYFSCETDSNAIRVQHHNYPDQITMLGCVKNLQERDIDDLGHLDIVLGGSPCDHLSLANWRRKGLHDETSSELLFREFVRILNYVKDKAERRGTELFWLFEYTAHIESSVKDEMSRCLGCDPVQICASHFVPMARRRNYWGNLTGIHDIPLKTKTTVTLQSFLRPHRTAVVNCLPTLTSNVASQRCGYEKLPPIVYEGKWEYLSINEMELIFGFPEHYTDCDNISVSQRRKLVGKSWSVHVVAELLKALAATFVTIA